MYDVAPSPEQFYTGLNKDNQELHYCFHMIFIHLLIYPSDELRS